MSLEDSYKDKKFNIYLHGLENIIAQNLQIMPSPEKWLRFGLTSQVENAAKLPCAGITDPCIPNDRK